MQRGAAIREMPIAVGDSKLLTCSRIASKAMATIALGTKEAAAAKDHQRTLVTPVDDATFSFRFDLGDRPQSTLLSQDREPDVDRADQD